MVETALPLASRGYHRVLAQNAWNVLPSQDFRRLTAPYPARLVRRMKARRSLARWNLKHADMVVCLTESMAELTAPLVRSELEISRVTLPMDVMDSDGRRPQELRDPSHSPTILVPGSVTWYKRPERAVQLAAELSLAAGRTAHVLFAGAEDGSGAWRHVCAEAKHVGVSVARQILDRSAIIEAFQTAETVLLPSELESLGFGLSEALVLSKTVIASNIPAHRELAKRVGREPTWITEAGPVVTPSHPLDGLRPRAKSASAVRGEWVDLGRILGLELADGGSMVPDHSRNH